MRKIASFVFLTLFAAAVVSAHGGNSHKLLGTVKEVHENHLVVMTKEGKELTLQLTDRTKYEKAGKETSKAELVTGTRVSVQLEEDDKTVATVKIGSVKSK